MVEENFSESWERRYGEKPQDMVDGIAPFLSHRSVRRFTNEPIPEALITALVATSQSAATSSNLQMWSAISVPAGPRREEIAKLCGDQDQVRNAGVFFAFIADLHRLKVAAEAVGEDAAGLDYAEFFVMAIIDAALAAERMVVAAESVGLGICYIGAMRDDPAGVNEFFGLPPLTFAPFGLCIGWPDPDHPAEIKPRLGQRSVVYEDRYPDRVSLGDYDERMKAFYESQGMKGDATWSMRSARRVDGKHMTGREVLLDWIRGQGMMGR